MLAATSPFIDDDHASALANESARFGLANAVVRSSSRERVANSAPMYVNLRHALHTFRYARLVRGMTLPWRNATARFLVLVSRQGRLSGMRSMPIEPREAPASCYTAAFVLNQARLSPSSEEGYNGIARIRAV